MHESRKLYAISCAASLVLIAVSANAQQTATATASLVNGFVVGITVTDGGSGYDWSPLVTIAGGGGAGAAAFATVSNSMVTSITVTNTGFGYTSTPQVLISPPVTAPFASSLILDLPFDGSVADDGPYHVTVLDSNGGTYVPDRTGLAGSAFALNGLNQNLSIPYDARLYPDEFTLSLWVNLQQWQESTILQAGNTTTDAWRGYELLVVNSQLQYADYTGSGFNALFDLQTNFLTGEWYQLVISRSSNSCAIYVNGERTATETNLTPYVKPQVVALLMGAGYNFNDSLFRFCPVTFDTFHIYNRPLSDSEVQTLYADEAAGMPPEVGIVVKTIRVNMMRLVPGLTYQLESSPIPSSSSSWTNVGPSFQATNSSAFEDIDIIGTPKSFYRVVELP